MNDDFEKLMNDVEELLKNEKIVTSISRIDNNLEMFMEDEQIDFQNYKDSTTAKTR